MNFFYTVITALSSAHFKIALAIFIFIVSVSFYLLSLTGKEKANKQLGKLERLREYDIDDNNSPMDNTNVNQVYNKYIKGYINKNKSLYDKMLNLLGIDVYDLQKQLIRANITKYNGEQLATLKLGGLMIGVFLGVTLFLFSGVLGLLIGVAIGFAISILPTLMINEQYENRRREILKVLPTTLRLLADATSTGHTIEDAISRVKRKYNNALSDEFDKVEKESTFTNDWIMALEHMDERCDIVELTNLVSEIKITKQRGTSITDVLVSYAKKMDKESMIRMTEDARKKTTTLLMPMLLFLFAPLIALILLPALNLILNAL